MKSNKIKTNWLLILIFAFHISSSEASHDHDDDDNEYDDDDDEVRLLVVGIRGQSRFIAADLLSGRKDGGQEDREIVKTPVITDEARRLMLVTGPNLCEEDTARQTFTTALFLSSPGPHAVLMVLNLEDQQSQQCDIEKRAQELLGAEVLQYCIVLLLQNHQEPFTGASRGIAGEMINACGGRFHIIRGSEPKPAQKASLVTQIDKLVWLNGDRFYSVPKQKLEKTNQNVHEENLLMTIIYDTTVVTVGDIVWTSIVSFPAHHVNPPRRHYYGGLVCVLFMLNMRHILNPEFSIPLNLAFITSLINLHELYNDINKIVQAMSNLSNYSINSNVFHIVYCALLTNLGTIIMSSLFMVGLALFLGTISSIRTWSDVLIACNVAPGVTFGAFAFTAVRNMSHGSPVFKDMSFMFCTLGAILSLEFMKVLFPLLDVKMLILGFTMACFYLKRETLKTVICFTVITVVLPCVCVLMGSVFLILGLMSFLRVITENLIISYLLYAALLFSSLIVICQ